MLPRIRKGTIFRSFSILGSIVDCMIIFSYRSDTISSRLSLSRKDAMQPSARKSEHRFEELAQPGLAVIIQLVYPRVAQHLICLLYTSDAADEL